jgi:hypothetical protein
MMFARFVFGVALAASVVVGAPPAHADPGDGIALNGTYTAFSERCVGEDERLIP